MKISNETKVGALTVVGIVLLVLGFNLLKGKNLFSRNLTLYAYYDNTQGLATSNPVRIHGLAVGSVSSIDFMDENVDKIRVTLSIKKGIDIPSNSVASIISADLLGSKAVRIDMGDSKTGLNDGDSIRAAVEGSFTSSLMKDIKPLSGKVQGTLTHLDSVLLSVNGTLDADTRRNLQLSIAEMKNAMQSFSRVADSLGQLTKNLNAITGNLRNNNEKISQIMDNTERATAKIADAPIGETLDNLNKSVDQLNGIIAKVNSPDGSLGLLINDKKLYNNLQATTYNLNLLMEDLRLNPKRYVHFSLFGRKETARPLPSDTTLKQ
ncbi:MlaD family protein [Compostibacter hankyongensis]|uniref:MlaD family protein n=1 Tax=Compostibacter hankyongensis TaxID=1007089 RepID=A0ABP8FQE2_9BACT